MSRKDQVKLLTQQASEETPDAMIGDHREIRLWLRMLAVTNLIQNYCRRMLLTEFDTTLARFDLMSQLHRVQDGLDANELSRRLLVSGGNVTGLIDMLELEQLVMREEAPEDGHPLRIKLSDEGRRQFARMAGDVEHLIVELFRGLSKTQLGQLSQLLTKVKQHASGVTASAAIGNR